MTKRKLKKKNIPTKIGVKRPRDHNDSAAIQVFEAQIHCLTLILFHLILLCLYTPTEQEGKKKGEGPSKGSSIGLKKQ